MPFVRKVAHIPRASGFGNTAVPTPATRFENTSQEPTEAAERTVNCWPSRRLQPGTPGFERGTYPRHSTETLVEHADDIVEMLGSDQSQLTPVVLPSRTCDPRHVVLLSRGSAIGPEQLFAVKEYLVVIATVHLEELQRTPITTRFE